VTSEEDILENRVQAVLELPWVLPALVVIQFTDEDLDLLDAAYDTDKYWTPLNGIVRRIQEDN
jgi:hypothetical protein